MSAALSRKEIGVLLDHVRDEGVRLKDTKKGIMLLLPNGTSTVLHFTNSDHRGTLNLRATLKRAGVSWPWDAHREAA